MDLCSVGIGGMNVVYGAAGTTANPPLVFVHGWGMSHRCWQWALPEFHLRYYCVAIDLPGFGLSDKPDIDYSIPSLANYLQRTLDALGIGTCDLVGHSMGGLTSLLFTLENPERVKRLCVVNPPMRGPEALQPLVRLALWPCVRRLVYFGRHIRWMRDWAARRIAYVSPLPDELVSEITRCTYRSMIETALSIRRTDIVPRLASLAMPALLVGCDRDGVIKPEQHSYWPHRFAPMAETGHFPMVERPAEFNRILTDFLA